MATVTIRDETIWVKHIENGQALRERILSLRPEETLDLEVNGVVGRWARMKNGRDGRPSLGIKPLSEMRIAWARMRRFETGKIVPIRELVFADSYLSAVAATLEEWTSAEDETAYAEL